MQLLLFIFAPFWAFIRSCYDLRSRASQVVFVLFFALFGYCHTYTDMRADSYRKSISFTTYQTDSIDEIVTSFQNGEIKDIYENTLFSILKNFTNDPHIMMMLVGLICGFFSMLVVKRILKDGHQCNTLPAIILITMIIVELNPVLMGGIRNFTAFTLFQYSLIRLTLDNKRKWLIGILIVPLIHFGWIIASGAAIVTWLVRLPSRFLHYVALIVCALSLFLETSSYNGVLNVMVDSMDNEAITDRIESYGDEDTEIEFNKSLTTRLLRVNNQIATCFVIILLIFLSSNRTQIINTPYKKRLYNLMLWFTIVGYSLISFSVVGQRFVCVSMMLIYILLFNIFKDSRDNSGIRRLIYTLPFVMIIHTLWTIYNCYCNVGWEPFILPLPALMMK